MRTVRNGGNKSWTQYRMDALDDAAKNILIKDSKAINPKFRLIIKFPNWYEHYQGLGYDVAVEPALFDGVYTGVETRDPIYSEQHLQQYESHSLMRYFENSRPGGTDGGWVDQLGTRYIDRYAEQIWDMAFAKPREITLWQWAGALQPINVGTRPWEASDTSLNLQKVRNSYTGEGNPLTGRIAGYAMEQVDTFVDKLGKPIGIAAYRPPHAIGEEFLYDYLGMIGIPIEFSPSLSTPTVSDVCLLTEGARYDPDIIRKIKAQLASGKNVVITSGLLRALNGKGIEDISEFEITSQRVGVTDFMARMGRVIPESTIASPIFFPVIHFLTNQSWSQVSGFDSQSPQNSYPILLYDAYDRGHFFVLAIPDNVADLYRLPEPVLNTIRSQIMGSFPIRLTNAPSQVSIFAYDNNTFVVQSFLPAEVKVTVSISGTGTFSGVTDLLSGQTLAPAPRSTERGGFGGRVSAPPGTNFAITIPPHSYRAFIAKN